MSSFQLTVDAPSAAEPLRFARIVVIGGGCYGAWYTQQLARAMGGGALVAESIVVVDRDPNCLVAQRLEASSYGSTPVHLMTAEWSSYLDGWLSNGVDALRADAMVPSPLMPHLCLDWLMGRAAERWPERRLRVEPLAVTPPMPWERAAPDGRHYVSFATWMCPVNCIEPVKCPATRGPRDWSMPPALASYVATRGVGIDIACIFHCVHRTYGVGMIDASAIADAELQLARAVAAQPFAPIRALVGTVSHCHGALGVLAVE